MVSPGAVRCPRPLVTPLSFATFFAPKINDVLASTAALSQTPVVNQTETSLSSFRSCTLADVRRIVMTSRAKSCSLDPVPTFIFREFVHLLLLYLIRMVNASLPQERLPLSQIYAVVTPLLDPTGMSNITLFRVSEFFMPDL